VQTLAVEELAEFSRRPLRAWNQDGLVDLAAAVYCAILGGLWFLPATPPVPVLRGVLTLLLLFSTRWAVRRLKASFVAPRVGYAEPRAPGRRAMGGAILTGIALAGLIVFADVRYPAASSAAMDALDTVLVPMLACLMAAVSLAAALWLSLPRYLVLACVSGAFGLWAFYSGAGPDAFPWLLVGCALALAATGAFAFVRFIRTHPSQEVRPA
jgi:hypothetical protein